MKKGCFVSLFLGLTVIIAVVIYLVRTKEDAIVGVVKDFTIGSVRDDFEKKLTLVPEGQMKDSLISVVNIYLYKAKDRQDFTLDRIGSFLDNAKHIVHDGSIDSTELDDLTELLNKELNGRYERPKKD